MHEFEQSYTIMTQDADAFGLWRPDAAFRLMQDLAGAHSTILGVSRECLLPTRGCVWMLARVELQVKRTPVMQQKLLARTWYGPPGRISYPRYVSILDETGEEIAALATSWVVVGLENRRLLTPEKAALPFPPASARQVTLPEPKRLRLNKTGEESMQSRIPLYGDIDVNGHMNNANYVSWVLDLFPLSWHAAHRLQSLHISYAAEAKPGETVNMHLFLEGLGFEVCGLDGSDGHTVFEAKGEWRALPWE